jgi:hypothetical protein
MSAPGPIDPNTLHRMRLVISTAIAARSVPVSEAAAEARGLCRGLHPALPATAADEAVTAILRELGALSPVPEPMELDGRQLRPAAPEDVADALAYAMRFDERGKARRTGLEYSSKLAADGLVRQLLLSGFVLMRKPPAPDHGSR